MKQRRKTIVKQNQISILATYSLGGQNQKVLIEGKNKDLPIVVCFHGGPGTPLPFSIGSRGMFPELTNHFIMVYWDQFGCGANNHTLDQEFNIDSLVDMAIDLIQELKDMFPNNKLILFGISFGSILTAKIVHKVPNLIDGAVACGQVLKELTLNEETIGLLTNTALSNKDKKRLDDLKQKTEYQAEDMIMIHRLIKKYTNGYQSKEEKGVPLGKILLGMLTSPDYRIKDWMAMFKNGYTNHESIFREIRSIDLTNTLETLKKPYFIIQGEYDLVTSTQALKRFVSHTHNKNIRCKIISKGSHMPGEAMMKMIPKELMKITHLEN